MKSVTDVPNELIVAIRKAAFDDAANMIVAGIPSSRWWDGSASRLVKQMLRELAHDIRSMV